MKFEGNCAPYLAYNIPRIRVADEDKVMDQDYYHGMLEERDATKLWELQESKYTVEDIIGLKRVDTPEIPVEAVREAIINSYEHRLYNNYQCNEIDVFKNLIEIHTTGGFLKGHTPEEFLDGNRKAIRRNKLITGVLYYSDDMETFATGLKRIKDFCDEAGCKVEFRTEVDDFVVAFYRNLREEWNKAENKNATSLDSTTKRLL